MSIDIIKWDERIFFIPTISFSWEDEKYMEFIWLMWGIEITI